MRSQFDPEYNAYFDLPITVTILDTHTNITWTDDRWFLQYWQEGNGCCDCNRADLAPDEVDFDMPDRGCAGSGRFLIVKVEPPIDTIDEFNRRYPKELIDQHIHHGVDQSPTS